MAVYTVDPFDAQMPFPLDLRYRKADLNGRNAIPANARYPGMLCWTDNERVVWVLDVGSGGDPADNTNWKQLYPAAGGATQNVTWSANAPTTQGSNGDIWFRDNADTGNVDLYFKAGGSWGLLGSWSKEGAVPTLQEVTDEGNVTNNHIFITGQNPIPSSGEGAWISSPVSGAARYARLEDGDITGQLSLGSGNPNYDAVLVGGGNGLAVQESTQLTLEPTGGRISRGGFPNILKPLTLADAVNEDHAVTKRQLDAVAPTYTPDPSLPSTGILAYLNTNYPSANIGDVVYREGSTTVRKCTKYAASKWSRVDETIVT